MLLEPRKRPEPLVIDLTNDSDDEVGSLIPESDGSGETNVSYRSRG